MSINYKRKYLKYKQKLEQLNMAGGQHDYQISVRDPWFTYISDGSKQVEGRLDKGLFSKLKIGDNVSWVNGNSLVKTRITNITKYPSFHDMISTEGLNRVLPNIKSIDNGINIYRQFYTESDEKRLGVLAITLQLI